MRCKLEPLSSQLAAVLQGLPNLFFPLSGVMSCVAWCPVSYTHFFFFFLIYLACFFGCFRWEGKTVL